MEQNFNKNSDLEDLNQNQSFKTDNYAVNFNSISEQEKRGLKKYAQKKFFGFLILAIAIVLLAGKQIYSNIFDPVKYEIPEWLAKQLSEEEDQAKTIADLRNNDTDQDGLTDYQELYQYYTSRFLEDTDSDGFTDFEEVNLGDDPLCPKGQSCNLLKLITPATKLSVIVQDVALDPDLTIAQAAATEFRKFLADNGMPQEDLDVLTDGDLLAIFSVVNESGILSEEELNATSTPAEIKQFLLSQPNTSIADVDALSDEELIAIAKALIAQ